MNPITATLRTLRRRRSTTAPESLTVEIVSMVAAYAGTRSGISWRGEVPIERLAARTPTGQLDVTAINDAIFRYFNAVLDSDRSRLLVIGYQLPSLSVGDLIYHSGRTFRVVPFGFEELTGDNFAYATHVLGLRQTEAAREGAHSDLLALGGLVLRYVPAGTDIGRLTRALEHSSLGDTVDAVVAAIAPQDAISAEIEELLRDSSR